MKHRSILVQIDLFSDAPTLAAFPNLHPHHDEIVELLAKLLLEVVVQMPFDHAQPEDHHDQN